MQWTWTCANSRRWWGTGRPGVLQSMGSQRAEHDWTAEQQSSRWGEPKKIKSVYTFSPSICHEVMGPDAMIFIFWMLFCLHPEFPQGSPWGRLIAVGLMAISSLVCWYGRPVFHLHLQNSFLPSLPTPWSKSPHLAWAIANWSLNFYLCSPSFHYPCSSLSNLTKMWIWLWHIRLKPVNDFSLILRDQIHKIYANAIPLPEMCISAQVPSPAHLVYSS